MNNIISCIIVDDERKASALLSDAIAVLFKNIRVKDVCDSWDTALEKLKTNHYDILFLDISMPEKNGIDMLRLLPALDTEIIFVTAHSEYAVQSFKFFPSGYLLKPIDEVELSVTVSKAIERINHKKKTETPTPSAKNKIGITSQKGVDYIDIEDILYIEAINSYCKVTTAEKEVTSSLNLANFKMLLENDLFMQVHRAYIVNLNYMDRYLNTGIIVLTDNTEIPVARNHRDELLQRFQKVNKAGQ